MDNIVIKTKKLENFNNISQLSATYVLQSFPIINQIKNSIPDEHFKQIEFLVQLLSEQLVISGHLIKHSNIQEQTEQPITTPTKEIYEPQINKPQNVYQLFNNKK